MTRLYSRLIENKTKSITLILAVLSIILGAVWQMQAISSQGTTIGTASDGSYVKRCYARERSATQNITFRWTPDQGASLQFWPLPPGRSALLYLKVARPDPATLTLKICNQPPLQVAIIPGQRIYQMMIQPGQCELALSIFPPLYAHNDPRSLGILLLQTELRMIATNVSDLLATFVLAPFLPLALAGISWAGLTNNNGYQLFLTPIILLGVIITGSMYREWRLEIAWWASHISFVFLLTIIGYRITKRWLSSHVHNDRTIVRWLAVIGIITIVLTFLPYISSDGVGYYAYARAITYRGDLGMEETFAALAPQMPIRFTSRGFVDNPWSVGPSLFWILPLAGYRWLFGGDGHDIGAIATVTLVSALFGFGTTIVAYYCARRWFSVMASALGALTAFFGSTLWFYSMREGGFAHALNAFACAFMVLAWIRVQEQPSYKRWFTLGVAAGLVVITYWATVLLLIIPVIGTCYLLWQTRHTRHQWRHIMIGIFIASLTAVIVFSPQIIIWQILYGSPLIKPAATPSINWNELHILELFFARFGLVQWSPAAMAGLIGLVLLARRSPLLGISLLGSTLLYITFNGLLTDWHGSGTFGTRRLTSLAVWYAIGLAAIIDTLAKRHWTGLALFGALASCGWMLMLLIRITLGYFPEGTTAYALERMSTIDWFLTRFTLPTPDTFIFFQTGFIGDILSSNLITTSLPLLGYLSFLAGCMTWLLWHLTSRKA